MKTAIRMEIENILKVTNPLCYIDPRKKGVRMKLGFTSPATPSQIKQIKQLPHVLKVGYAYSKELFHRPTIDGVTIYFDCSTKAITLPIDSTKLDYEFYYASM